MLFIKLPSFCSQRWKVLGRNISKAYRDSKRPSNMLMWCQNGKSWIPTIMLLKSKLTTEVRKMFVTISCKFYYNVFYMKLHLHMIVIRFICILQKWTFVVSSCRYYHPQTKLRKGYVFTPVCQSFCSQGGSTWAHLPPPGQVHTPPGAGTPRPTVHAGIRSTSGRYASH